MKTFSGCHKKTGQRQETETKEERGEDDEAADHDHDQLHRADQPELHLRHHRLQLQQGEHRGGDGELGDQPQEGAPQKCTSRNPRNSKAKKNRNSKAEQFVQTYSLDAPASLGVTL